jgi:hypothetical protein
VKITHIQLEFAKLVLNVVQLRNGAAREARAALTALQKIVGLALCPVAMMARAITSPVKVRVARIYHPFAVGRMIGGSRLVRIGTIVVVIFLPPPLMIMSIMVVSVLPMPIVMVPPMVVVCRRLHWKR